MTSLNTDNSQKNKKTFYFFTCMDVLFVFLQRILALEPLSTANSFTNKPGITFAGFLVLFETVQDNQREEINPHAL